MSAAAEGIAGLAFGAVSVAALFTTCIECFDIVVAGKNFSEDFEQLYALFSLHRTRFGLWGESVGLVPSPNNERPLRYDRNLDRPDIRPEVERILWNIKALLEEADRLDERYGMKADVLQGPEVSSSRGINVFKASFDRFKGRIRKHQKETSAWNVTRWAIHDAAKFGGVINRLEKFVDGLQGITKSLGLLEEQRARLREEIESISDLESLRLLCEASSSHRSSQHDISDTASRRLITVAESISEQRTLASTSIVPETARSFVTANTSPSTATKSQISDAPPVPGGWPKSVRSDSSRLRLGGPRQRNQPRGAFKPSPSCEECLEEHYKCITDAENESCTRCIQTRRACSFWRELKERTKEPIKAGLANQLMPAMTPDAWTPTEGLPQNRRLLSGVIGKAKARQPLSFAAGDAHYGERLATIKNQDENYWCTHSGKILGHANSSSSAAKRMFIDLRNIRAGKVPFISAVPLDDRLDKVLASVEGPPETPYEGGVFWITVKLSENDPDAPPMMRFHTKVYHPNISPQGHICTNYDERWNSNFPAGTHKSPVKDPSAVWYRAKSPNAEWTLGALLTAICGLLASPDVDDPLVPEIAQKYLEDFDGYCRNARLYTQRFATGERPDESQLLFLEDLHANLSTMASSKISQPLSGREVDLVSLQRSLREKYDEVDLVSLQRSLLREKYDDSISDHLRVVERSSADDDDDGVGQSSVSTHQAVGALQAPFTESWLKRVRKRKYLPSSDARSQAAYGRPVGRPGQAYP